VSSKLKSLRRSSHQTTESKLISIVVSYRGLNRRSSAFPAHATTRNAALRTCNPSPGPFGPRWSAIATAIFLHVVPASLVAYAIMNGKLQHQLGSILGTTPICVALALDVEGLGAKYIFIFLLQLS
jgi:hypothetical protein